MKPSTINKYGEKNNKRRMRSTLIKNEKTKITIVEVTTLEERIELHSRRKRRVSFIFLHKIFWKNILKLKFKNSSRYWKACKSLQKYHKKRLKELQEEKEK